MASRKKTSGAAGRKQLDELTEALNYPWTPRGSKTYNREEAEALIDQEEIDRKRRLLADLDGTYNPGPDEWDEEDERIRKEAEEETKEAADEDEGEDIPPLPKPEEIRPIFQAVKTDSDTKTPGGFSEPARKDLNPGYYEQARSNRSTAVQALQWIPLEDEGDGDIKGDILVAFARPSSNQTGSYGALYFAQDEHVDTWEELKATSSFGMFVKDLGLIKFDGKSIAKYLRAHEDKSVSYWIWEDANISTNRDAGDIARIKAENAAILSKKMSSDKELREKNRKRPFKARPKKKT